MKSLKEQAILFAAQVSPLITGGPTIGPDSDSSFLEEHDGPTIRVSPAKNVVPAFNDSQWDHSVIFGEEESALDDSVEHLLTTVRSVAQHMYMGEMERLRREMVRQELQKRARQKQVAMQAFRDKATREAQEKLKENSCILQKAFDDQVKSCLETLDAKEARFAQEDQKRLVELAKRKEVKNNLLRRQAEKAKINAFLDQIQGCQRQIRSLLQKYEEITGSLEREQKSVFDERFRAAIPPQGELKVTAGEVQKWQDAQKVVEKVISEVETFIQKKHQQEQQQVEEQAKVPKEPAPVQAAVTQAPVPQATVAQAPVPQVASLNTVEPNLAAFISASAQKEYSELEAFTFQFQEQLRPLMSDPNQKTFLRSASMGAVTLLGILGKQDLQRKLEKLGEFLSGGRIQVNQKLSFCAQDHPLGTRYCTWLLAQRLLASKFTSSLPEYARAVVYLSHRFPDFGRLFKRFMHQQYPTTVPYSIPQYEDQPDEEYRAALGYRKGETLKEYLDRVADVTQLHATILVTPCTPGENHILPLETGWRWLADVLNREPEQHVTALVLRHFLDVAGHQLQKVYGRQFTRLIAVLKGPYLSLIRGIEAGDESYMRQLEVLLEDRRW